MPAVMVESQEGISSLLLDLGETQGGIFGGIVVGGMNSSGTTEMEMKIIYGR